MALPTGRCKPNLTTLLAGCRLVKAASATAVVVTRDRLQRIVDPIRPLILASENLLATKQ
jgi:hypothetical protein